MKLDRAEWTGTGAALLLHVALIGALTLRLAQVDTPPELPSMEVELADSVALASAAPSSEAPPPSASPAPDVEKVPEPDQAMPTPAPPTPTPPPPPVATPPAPKARPQPTPPRATPRPAPSGPAKAQPVPTRPAPAAPRGSAVGDDFLKGIADPSARARPASAASAARFDANALAGIQQAIRRQIQPCADRQVDPGPGANRIKVTLNIRLSPTGRLMGPPRVVRTAGVDDENARFEERVKDLAVAAYTGCAPLSGLPSELYQTPSGGWSNINMTYRLP